MSGPAASRSEHHLVVGWSPTPSATPMVWLQPAPGGFVLPHWLSAEQRAADVAELTRAASDRLGAEVSVLRCLSDVPAGKEGVRHQVHDLDVHGVAPTWSPAGPGRWFGAAEVEGLPLARPEHGPLLAEWFRARRARPLPPDGQDWILPGWRDQVSLWVDGQLSRKGLPPLARIEQVRVWEFSNVLRLWAGDVKLYFKAVAASVAGEPPLVERLATLHPAVVPDVLAIEPARRWLLMRASPGPPLDEVADIARWAQAAETLARVQIDSLRRLAELRALGCAERPLAWLAEEIDPLLDDTAAMQPQPAEALTSLEIERLRARGPELHALCRELDAYGVPTCLEHGDFWAANVVATDRGCVLIDWEDATLSHPFLSAYLLLTSLDYADAIKDKPAARDRIRRAYLGPWREASPDRAPPAGGLERAFELAMRLAPLHHAVQFRLGVWRIETSWEVRAFLPFFLRRLLDAGC
jgi:phosphotransferase family enzyme